MKSYITLYPKENQASKQGSEMHTDQRMLRNYIHGVIREHGNFNGDYFSLFANDLPLYEKKIFMSYILSPAIYSDLTCNEYLEEMQEIINNEIDDFYHEWNNSKGFDL
jgi:hypothetical protein